MKAFRIVLATAVVVASLVALCPAPAAAADYWNGYWGWYDSTYVPYYQRYYSAPTPYAPAYSSYYAPPAYGYYGPGYAAPYYPAPGVGVGVYPGVAAARVGPLRLGWR